MSDTPRMDQMEKLAYWFNDDMTPVCESRFVRPLEMELNAANAIIRQQQLLDEELNELRSDEARLLNLNGELERRIKRLEEAGDAMFPWSERVGQEFWNKAKEAKP